MGFRVTYQRQIEEEGDKDCFDGITSVAKHGKVKLQKVATSEET